MAVVVYLRGGPPLRLEEAVSAEWSHEGGARAGGTGTLVCYARDRRELVRFGETDVVAYHLRPDAPSRWSPPAP